MKDLASVKTLQNLASIFEGKKKYYDDINHFIAEETLDEFGVKRIAATIKEHEALRIISKYLND